MICKLFLILVSLQVVAAEMQMSSHENGTYLGSPSQSSGNGKTSAYALRFPGPRPWAARQPGTRRLCWAPPCPAPRPKPQPVNCTLPWLAPLQPRPVNRISPWPATLPKPRPVPCTPKQPAPQPGPPPAPCPAPCPEPLPAPELAPQPEPCTPTPPSLLARNDARECDMLCDKLYAGDFMKWHDCFDDCVSMGIGKYKLRLEQKPAPKRKPWPEPKPEPQPVPQPEPRPEPNPEPRPEPKPEPRPAPQPKPEPKPEPAPNPIPSAPSPAPRPPVPKPESLPVTVPCTPTPPSSLGGNDINECFEFCEEQYPGYNFAKRWSICFERCSQIGLAAYKEELKKMPGRLHALLLRS